MDTGSIFNSVLALIFVLALIALVSILLRKYSSGKIHTDSKGKRLSVTDMMQIDPKRRLIIVQRDETEHLILLSNDQDTVIETFPSEMGMLRDKEV